MKFETCIGGLASHLIARDFSRDVYCLFGLPVDNLTLAGTKALLRDLAGQQGESVLSTINVNWVAQSLRDPQFKAAILDSDIVTLDGMPLLWLAKVLGYPMTEVVAGSTLIQEIHQEKNQATPLSIFLFGGKEGAGEQAMAKINAAEGGLKAVGSISPGFGTTMAQMSSEEIIGAINRAEPDILLVALGASKGTRWIEHNRHRLKAKITSHLGATINFLAGTVQRAPQWVSKSGLEWIWRILQEPKLFTRYAGDGIILLLLLLRCFPSWFRFKAWQKKYDKEKAAFEVLYQEDSQGITLSFGRNLTGGPDSPLRSLFIRAALAGKDITLDFGQTEFADGAFAALLLILAKHQGLNNRNLRFANVHGRLAVVFKFFGVGGSKSA